MQVLGSGLLERHGITKIVVAGYPEGSPDISETEVRVALAEKNAWTRDADAEVYIETQFCFEADTIVAGLAETVAGDPDSLLHGVHFYPFGGLAKTTAWLNAAATGNFRIKPNGGFDRLEDGAATASAPRAVS
jgi:5,10-methylenetetrahydrofolate reductase